MPEAADSGLDDDRKDNHSMLPSSNGKRKKAVAGGDLLWCQRTTAPSMTAYPNNTDMLQA